MSQTSGLCLCLVILVCLAGCNALTGETTTEPPSITPAEIPTDDPNATQRLAPGLTNHGVVDPSALANAHEAVLTNTSFTRKGTMTKKYTNGTIRTQRVMTTRMVAPKDRYYINVEEYGHNTNRYNQTPDNLSYWSNGERVFVASPSSKMNTTTYHHWESATPADLESGFIRGEMYSEWFQIFDTKVSNHTTHNGTTLYRVTATGIADPDRLTKIFPDTKQPRNLTFHAMIDSRGLVHEYRLAYTATLTETNRPTPIQIVSGMRHTNIGATTVDRPSWYTTANRTTPTTPNSRS